MLTRQKVLDILSEVWYKDWRLVVGDDGGRLWLQWKWDEAKVAGNTIWTEAQSSRKWRLSPYMTPSEVVQTAFKAVLTAEEHEARESFKYRGERVFDPHFDIEALYEIAVAKRTSRREGEAANGS